MGCSGCKHVNDCAVVVQRNLFSGLCVQGNHNGSDSTSQESSPPATRRRRPSAKALASSQTSGKKKQLRQKRLPFAEGAFRGMGDFASSAFEGSGDGMASGSFLAIIANAAVAVDGLKRVRSPPPHKERLESGAQEREGQPQLSHFTCFPCRLAQLSVEHQRRK